MWWHYKYGLSPLAPRPPPPGIHSLTLTEEMTPFVNGETESQKSCDLPKTTQLGGRGFQIVTILPSPWKTVFPWWVKAPQFSHSRFGKLTLCNDRGMPGQSSWDPTLRWGCLLSVGQRDLKTEENWYLWSTLPPGHGDRMYVCFILFGFQSKHMRWLFMSPFFRLGNWGPAQLSDLPCLGQVESGRSKARLSSLTVCAPVTTSGVPIWKTESLRTICFSPSPLLPWSSHHPVLPGPLQELPCLMPHRPFSTQWPEPSF